MGRIPYIHIGAGISLAMASAQGSRQNTTTALISRDAASVTHIVAFGVTSKALGVMEFNEQGDRLALPGALSSDSNVLSLRTIRAIDANGIQYDAQNGMPYLGTEDPHGATITAWNADGQQQLLSGLNYPPSSIGGFTLEQ